MSAREQAFAKLGMWLKEQTTLKLTVLAKEEQLRTYIVNVASIDEDRCLVGFAIPRTRSFLPPICFGDASFEVGNRVLKAERPAGDLLKCEEVSP